ncbi:Rapid ALkalinization Factor [Trema orientale]|uniref:Rapid ALkalinization Factor n=1 Tax=Trema orientale TaxID=63057 RepID=A0A2P5FCH2_TREOI|nr:Rapid ALkalinization Factor [Trema orientale]
MLVLLVGSVSSEYCSVEAGEEEEQTTRRRRSLQGGKSISPGALRRDLPFCGKVAGGLPYAMSCLPQPSNPHERGCLKIYRCRK